MAKTASPSSVTIKNLRLPESLYDQLAERAAKQGRSVEDEIFVRLRDCREHTAQQPIYLNDAQRAELSTLVGKLIRTPEELLKSVHEMAGLKVAGIEISLGEQLIKRLETRRFGKTLSELLKGLIPAKLEEEVGLR